MAALTAIGDSLLEGGPWLTGDEEFALVDVDHRGERCCSVCGCTDDHACVVEGLRCAWISRSLCSSCAWAEPNFERIGDAGIWDDA